MYMYLNNINILFIHNLCIQLYYIYIYIYIYLFIDIIILFQNYDIINSWQIRISIKIINLNLSPTRTNKYLHFNKPSGNGTDFLTI